MIIMGFQFTEKQLGANLLLYPVIICKCLSGPRRALCMCEAGVCLCAHRSVLFKIRSAELKIEK